MPSQIPDFYVLALVAALMILFSIVAAAMRKVRAQFAIAVIFMLILIARLVIMLIASDNYSALNLFSANPFSLFVSLLFTVGVLLVNILAYAKDASYSNFSLLSVFALMGMYMVAMSTSLVSIFIGLELMSIPTIFAMLLSKRVAIEASVKLFILASVAIALFSFGMVMVFGSSGSVALSGNVTTGLLALGALAVLIAALAFDSALFPFNLWVPDVYQGANTYITALIGGINKKVGFIALMQVLFLLFVAYKTTFVPIIYALAILTMFYGNLAALAQKNVKRMLAYSSIAHAGYISIGIAVATAYALGAALFQIAAHMIMFIGALAIVLFMESRNRHEINDYIGLHKENGFASFSLAIILLGLIGTPLTIGFIGKFLLFSSAVYANMLPLAIIGIINSIISVYYYFRVVSAMYSEKSGVSQMKMHRNVAFVVLACVLLTIVLGVYPNLLLGLANAAGTYLVG
ncbi:MAG: NADH-quinone oxidoreductase subunit N [Candidatus Micrarchaeota archaeon]|nr:NADH-quinone oxidoreductase subunit N [Candidatus Micrarchaeota archaeon]